MNLVRGLPSDCHKRSPFHHIDSHHTSHWTTVPIIHCTDDKHTAECTDYTAEANHMPYISHGLSHSDHRLLSSVYCSPSDSYSTERFRGFRV